MSIQFCQCPQLLQFSWLAMSRPKAFLRKAPSPLYSPPRPIPAPKPMPIGIGREFALVNQARAISSSVSRLR